MTVTQNSQVLQCSSICLKIVKYCM